MYMFAGYNHKVDKEERVDFQLFCNSGNQKSVYVFSQILPVGNTQKVSFFH